LSDKNGGTMAERQTASISVRICPLQSERLKPATVDCYAGYRGEQQPVAVVDGQRKRRITRVCHSWKEQTATTGTVLRCFAVEDDESRLLVLAYNEQTDQWLMAVDEDAQ